MIAIDFESFRFASPVYLWLLLVPAALLIVWGWRVVRRRANVRRLAAQRIVPVRQRFGPVGDLAFWACALVAALTAGVIAGAALDVFADEPRVPDGLLALAARQPRQSRQYRRRSSSAGSSADAAERHHARCPIGWRSGLRHAATRRRKGVLHAGSGQIGAA